MEKKLRGLRENIEQKLEELQEGWVNYVKVRGEVPLKGYCISLYQGFCEPMVKMFYHEGDIVFEDEYGNQEYLSAGGTLRTYVDMELAVFGA